MILRGWVAGRIRDRQMLMILFGGHFPTYIRAHVPVASLSVLIEQSLEQEHQGA